MIGDSFKEDTRGQTLFDFIIGVLLLFTAMIFVVMFVPNMLSPFAAAGGDATIVDSERVAGDITYDVLREAGQQPYVLDKDCVVSFFTGTSTSGCDLDVSDRRALVGVSDRTDLMITLRDPADGSVETISGSTMEYATSDKREKEVHKSMRVVSVDGNKYELHVEVW